jgi:hypothetical protein
MEDIAAYSGDQVGRLARHDQCRDAPGFVKLGR